MATDDSNATSGRLPNGVEPAHNDLMRYISMYLGILRGDKYDMPLPDMPGPSWTMTAANTEGMADA